jgi:hypothetical protein
MNDRETIETQLADARRARGFAHLHHKNYDDSVIIALQQKLDALDDVESAKTEQAREGAAAQHDTLLKKTKAEIEDLTAASTAALAEAEVALRKAVAAQRTVHQLEAAKRKKLAELNKLTGSSEPITTEPELHRQNSRRWLAVIRTITNHPGEWGALKYPGMSLPKDTSWT